MKIKEPCSYIGGGVIIVVIVGILICLILI